MNIKPTSDNVCVIVETSRETHGGLTDGGVWCPKEAGRLPARGRVVAVGPGRPLPSGGHGDMSTRCGDDVEFDEFEGFDFTLADRPFKLISERHIKAIRETS